MNERESLKASNVMKWIGDFNENALQSETTSKLWKNKGTINVSLPTSIYVTLPPLPKPPDI